MYILNRTAAPAASFPMCQAAILPAVTFHLAQNNDSLNGGQWLLVNINMDKFDGRAERINITLPHRLLNRIDSLVQQHPGYGSRSAFLAAAARNELLKAG